jgi:adenosine deaminase
MNAHEGRPTTIDAFRRAPKIDLHRHLLGSARPDTLWELARKYECEAGRLPPEAFRQAIVRRTPAHDLADYIRPWSIFRELIRTPEDVYRIAREAAEDARHDGVVYVEFRSSLPGLPITDGGAPQTRIAGARYLGAIRDAFADTPGIVCRLVASVPRHAVGRATSHQLADYTDAFLRDISAYRELVVGVDLTGIEHGWPARKFGMLFAEARRAGLPVTVHAGETEGPEEIWAAIDDLGATRIGHGTSAVTDPVLVQELVRRDIAIEVCPTVGWLTGRLTDRRWHPVIECEPPLHYVVCTDNPTLNASVLSLELFFASQGADAQAFCRWQFHSARRAAFAPGAVPVAA